MLVTSLRLAHYGDTGIDRRPPPPRGELAQRTWPGPHPRTCGAVHEMVIDRDDRVAAGPSSGTGVTSGIRDRANVAVPAACAAASRVVGRGMNSSHRVIRSYPADQWVPKRPSDTYAVHEHHGRAVAADPIAHGQTVERDRPLDSSQSNRAHL